MAVWGSRHIDKRSGIGNEMMIIMLVMMVMEIMMMMVMVMMVVEIMMVMMIILDYVIGDILIRDLALGIRHIFSAS